MSGYGTSAAAFLAYAGRRFGKTRASQLELEALLAGPHASWCPWMPPSSYRCLCRFGTLELSDPRPEVVEAAVARYRARHRERYA